ncbi:hypothetical protein DMB66_41795 [Actinoplanes sp. ATCC 53533]|nr:hypothetical protein DMB66_41795 [Actinoplanes sp. ATCC 53533]
MLMIAAFAFALALVGVLLIPLILGRLFTSEGDYSRISDIGQAYGAASAVISAVALGVVVLGQYRQAHRARLQALFDMTDELVQLAMDEPMYRQCWGARMAPDEIDEALFYYCNRMIKSWKIAWELRDLSEAQARAYLGSFFQSEIPRLFWHQHGQWQMRARLTNRRGRFVVVINEEYLRAIHAGPPTRTREFCQPSRRRAKPPRRHLVDADDINDRPTAP